MSDADSVVEDLARSAGLEKQSSKLTRFLFFRALGGDKKSIASDLGVSAKTLTRWENKINENLTGFERTRLVVNAVRLEYDKQYGDAAE